MSKSSEFQKETSKSMNGEDYKEFYVSIFFQWYKFIGITVNLFYLNYNLTFYHDTSQARHYESILDVKVLYLYSPYFEIS